VYGREKLLNSWPGSQKERMKKTFRVPKLPLGTPPITQRSPTRPHFLAILPLPNSVVLGDKPPTHGVLKDIQDANYSRDKHILSPNLDTTDK
jgi:hypothetical protein